MRTSYTLSCQTAVWLPFIIMATLNISVFSLPVFEETPVLFGVNHLMKELSNGNGTGAIAGSVPGVGGRDRGGGGGGKAMARPVEYMSGPTTGAAGSYLAAHYVMECGDKLHVKEVTAATAAAMLHSFYRTMDHSVYDHYVIAASCLSLAAKLRDEPLKLRNVLNVCYQTLHRSAGPLELGEEYQKLKMSLSSAELFVLRTLSFKLDFPLPHKYLLHYLKSLKEWFPVGEWQSTPIARTSVAFLQDFYLSPSVLDYQPPHIAVACLCLALSCLGVSVPLTLTKDEDSPWYCVLTKDLTKEKTWEIMEKIMMVYNKDNEMNG